MQICAHLLKKRMTEHGLPESHNLHHLLRLLSWLAVKGILHHLRALLPASFLHFCDFLKNRRQLSLKHPMSTHQYLSHLLRFNGLTFERAHILTKKSFIIPLFDNFLDKVVLL